MVGEKLYRMKITGYITIDLLSFEHQDKDTFVAIGLDCYLNDYVCGILFQNFLTNSK